MKKSFLLLAAGVIAAAANGQQITPSAVFLHSSERITPFTGRQTTIPAPAMSESMSTDRTTSGGSRWYDYTAGFHNAHAPFTMYCDSMARFSLGGSVVEGFEGLPIWQDTANILGYGNGAGGYVYDYNPFTSLGLSLDPYANIWNRADSFAGQIAVTAATAYTIDSVQVVGWYNRSYRTAYKIGVVDTLVLAFVQGNPSAASTAADMPAFSFSSGATYGITGSLVFVDMMHDSINNRAGHYLAHDTISAPPLTLATEVYKIPLRSTDTNNFNSTVGTTFPRPGHTDPLISYAVAAHNMASMSVSFISGDTNFHATHTSGAIWGDTIRYINSTGSTITGYKYGNFEPEIAFASSDGTGANVVVPPYMGSTFGDWTDGFFKREGPGNGRDAYWGGTYLPTWAWIGASTLQYPVINYHVSCATCGLTGASSLDVQNVATVNTINAYPNPASGHLNISYSLVSSSDASVTLTNMVGQVVATQKMAKASSGNVVFNTSALPDGIYIYNLSANGVSTTGRVAIAH